MRLVLTGWACFAVGIGAGWELRRTTWLRVNSHDPKTTVQLIQRGRVTEDVPPIPFSVTSNGFSVRLVR